MIENNPENNLQIESGKKFFTAQARRAHVRAYQSSGQSMIMYCDKHHLALSTFKTWVTKYGEKLIPAQFVPMTLASKNPNDAFKKTKSLSKIEIHAGDIKIVISEVANVETLIQLIKGLSHANSTKSSGNLVL